VACFLQEPVEERREPMNAAEVMTTDVVAVAPETLVEEIARLLLRHRISAVPVVDATGRLLGIVSEGDLLRLVTPGTAERRAWWLELLSDSATPARDPVETRVRRAADVMTPDVVTVGEDTPVGEIARLLESRGIKRVPVVREGRVTGIVSRADLIRTLASRGAGRGSLPAADSRATRERVLAALRAEPWWAGRGNTSIVVDDGVVHLWGFARSPAERAAMRVAAHNTPGVRRVEDHLIDWRGWAGID
jgi:CBS domain-containing protein